MPGFRRKIAALFVGGVLLAVGMAVILLVHEHRRLSYQGKSLAYWVSQMPLTLVIWDRTISDTIIVSGANVQIAGNNPAPPVEKPGDVTHAIQAIGADAVPFLLARLKTRDTQMKIRLQNWATRLGFTNVLFTPAIFARGQALTALDALKPLPDYAVAQLRSLSTNADREIATSARLLLKDKPPPVNPHETDTVIIRSVIRSH